MIGVEECDDGDPRDDDGCDAACRLTGPCLNSLLANPGFEDGALSPWKTNGDVDVSTENPHSEQWSAVITRPASRPAMSAFPRRSPSPQQLVPQAVRAGPQVTSG